MKNHSIPTLFVAFSHTLTQSQIDGFKSQYGMKVGTTLDDMERGYDYEYYIANIVTLKDVAPELQAQMSQIPATATLNDIQALAQAIVAEAVKVSATHFFMVGEPTLTMWANLYASQMAFTSDSLMETFPSNGVLMQAFAKRDHAQKPMVCLQSTTERRSVDETQPDGSVKKIAIFSHVTWREMF